jgi:hypothetical protein
MLLTGAVLLCVSPVSAELSANRSILEQGRSEVNIFRPHAARSNDLLIGALTLDNVYSFDFANAGMGTLIFRARSNRPSAMLAEEITREMPQLVGEWSRESSSFESVNFFPSGGFHRRADSSLSLNSEADSDPFSGGIAAAPEPSTWVGAALALVVIGFTQRRKVSRFLRHTA